jgi:hypothetical protein
MYRLAVESVRRVLWIPLLLVAISCEYGLTDNIGISRARDGRLVANVFSCATDESIQLNFLIDPDTIEDTGDETILWRVQGSTTAPGLLRVVIGEAPSGFREEVPLTARVQPSRTYTLSLHWDRLDMGIYFVPSEVPLKGIESGGTHLSTSDFIEIGKNSCDS